MRDESDIRFMESRERQREKEGGERECGISSKGAWRI